MFRILHDLVSTTTIDARSFIYASPLSGVRCSKVYLRAKLIRVSLSPHLKLNQPALRGKTKCLIVGRNKSIQFWQCALTWALWRAGQMRLLSSLECSRETHQVSSQVFYWYTFDLKSSVPIIIETITYQVGGQLFVLEFRPFSELISPPWPWKSSKNVCICQRNKSNLRKMHFLSFLWSFDEKFEIERALHKQH